jgi:hypothetical protein
VDYTEDAITKRIAGEYTRADGRDAERDVAFDDILVTSQAEPQKADESAGIDARDTAKRGKDKRHRPAYTRPAPAVNLIVDINNCVKAQQSAGFARWQKIQNLKEAAKTLNFLTENNLLHYTDLEAKNAEVGAAFDEAAAALKAAEKRLADMSALMKHIGVYQRTKPIYDGIKTAATPNDKAAYRRAHASDISRHESAARALRKYTGNGGGKLPGMAALQAEYARLALKKDTLQGEYGVLKRQAREYGSVITNVQRIISPDETQRRRLHSIQR